ncbi:SURF1 family cytochrome oxidase biogenesis protein [Sphingobium vermicomposti]|uniref:SURF1-like protein n=1 Tax=Sphingobium vermicomposti TaxID=529005 RepID=A0A846MFU0_9SPHN|nr:surfeit locus 1 family protein [Sphingobium vermicomposti]
MIEKRRPTGVLIGLSIIAALLFAGLVSLGIWQIHRLEWKRALIHQVETRIHDRPRPAPPLASPNDTYLRIAARGHFLHDQATLVQASTIRGPGYWVMTPLITDRGFTMIVNRGFVPPDRRSSYARPVGTVRIVGLLRQTEPRGGFLRANDPKAGRWYSRDVAAISRNHDLPSPVANYFLDQEYSTASGTLPIGGLTIVRFPNNHLPYAITWFALAAMVAGAYIVVMRHEWKVRRA